MAWDEWERLKADAGSRSSSHMQLNQVPNETGAGGGQQGDLKVDQQTWPRSATARSNCSRTSAATAVTPGPAARTPPRTSRRRSSSSGDLDTVQERWEKSLTTLLDACAHISNHMDFTKKAHAGDEYHIASTVSSIATLDKGFDEGTKR